MGTEAGSMGVDHGVQRGQVPLRIWTRRTLRQIVPLRFRHIGSKMGVVAFKNTPKSVFGRGGNTPPHTPPHSAPTYLRRSPCVPPQKSSQIYAYGRFPLMPQSWAIAVSIFVDDGENQNWRLHLSTCADYSWKILQSVTCYNYVDITS